jgi:hypothetical protein
MNKIQIIIDPKRKLTLKFSKPSNRKSQSARKIS